jgi:hypothetical protein
MFLLLGAWRPRKEGGRGEVGREGMGKGEEWARGGRAGEGAGGGVGEACRGQGKAGEGPPWQLARSCLQAGPDYNTKRLLQETFRFELS